MCLHVALVCSRAFSFFIHAGIEDFDWIALSDPRDAQCLELVIRTSLEGEPALLRFYDARTAEDWKEKCNFNKKLQVCEN